MKRLFSSILLLLVFLSITPAAVAQKQAVRLTKFEGKQITGIIASSAFDIEIRQGNDTKAIIEISPEIESYLIFTMEGNYVRIGLNNYSGKSLRNPHMKAYITVSSLDYLKLSGSTTLVGYGAFTGTAVQIESSGASDIKDLDVRSIGALSVKLTGSSDLTNVRLAGNDNIQLIASGASDVTRTTISSPKTVQLQFSGSADASTLEVNGAEVNMVQSSASDTRLTINATTLDFNISGSADAIVKGAVTSAKIECTSASSFSGRELSIREAVVKTAGSAKAIVNVADRGEFEASSASSIRYLEEPASYNNRSSSSATISKLRR